MPKRCHSTLAGLIAALIAGHGVGAAGPLQEVSREAGLGGVEAIGAMGADYDRDGARDLLLAVRGRALALYRNRQGRFEETGLTFGRPGEEMSAAAWGDYDGDGDPDLFVTSRDGVSRLYRNDGGAFKDVAAAMGVETGGGMAAAWGDFDGDGDPDLAVGRVGALRLYRNEGRGFAEVAASYGLSNAALVPDVAWVDFDGDGRPDLFCAGVRSPNRLYRNTGGAAGFVDVAAPMGVAESRTTRLGVWGDFDNDGDPDLYLVNGDGPNRLLRNGGSRFKDVAAEMGVAEGAGLGVGAAWVDFDSDGDLDLHLTNQLGPDRLFRNDGDRFVDISQDLGVGQGEVVNAVWGDFDLNGILDLFEARVGVPALYRGPEAPNEGLTVRVAGPPGARVTVIAGGVRQTRETQDGLATFGLGRQAGIVDVTVGWPDGRERRLISSEVSRTLRAAPEDRLPEMVLETGRVDFGTAERPVEALVRVANRGTAQMTIRSALVNDGAFEVRVALPASVPPGGSIGIPVRYTPGPPGLRTATLTVQSDDPWHGQQSVPLTALVPRRAGDLNSDGQVDLEDFFALAGGVGKRTGEPGFDRDLDLNGDGKIDLEDLFVFQDAMGGK